MIRLFSKKVDFYIKLMPELFFRGRKSGEKLYYRYGKTRRRMTYLRKSFSSYRGVLVVYNSYNGRRYSAYIYNWKNQKKQCIAVELSLNSLKMEIDNFFDTYKSQLIYNKDKEPRAFVVDRLPCIKEDCPYFNLCGERLKVRNIKRDNKYFEICSQNVTVRDDKELQLNSDVPSPFISISDRKRLDKINKEERTRLKSTFVFDPKTFKIVPRTEIEQKVPEST